MSTLNIALLLLAALVSRESGTGPRPASATFLSVITIFALAVLPACNPVPPGVELSPVASLPVAPPEETPTLGPAATLTATPFVDPPVINCFELLQEGHWIMQGEANGEAQPEYFQAIEGLLQDQEVLQIIIDIHGASFDEGELKDESAIIIDQPDGQRTVASVVDHGLENGKDGPQPVYIPLSDFMAITSDGEPGAVLDLSQPYGPLHARFWNEADFTVEISSIMACTYQRV